MYYDPMIAKLSVHAGSRRNAIDRAIGALKQYAVLGVTTNVEYLISILQEGAFADGDLHTGFLDEEMPDWQSNLDEDDDLALAVAAVAEHQRLSSGTTGSTPSADNSSRTTPWSSLGRFRLNGLG